MDDPILFQVKGEVFCFRYPYFYFWNGESTSRASQQTYTASRLSKDLTKVTLLLQNLVVMRGKRQYFSCNVFFTFIPPDLLNQFK